jgi:hypothetical protein
LSAISTVTLTIDLLRIVKRFSNAGYHNKLIAIIGFNELRFINFIIINEIKIDKT